MVNLGANLKIGTHRQIKAFTGLNFLIHRKLRHRVTNSQNELLFYRTSNSWKRKKNEIGDFIFHPNDRNFNFFSFLLKTRYHTSLRIFQITFDKAFGLKLS